MTENSKKEKIYTDTEQMKKWNSEFGREYTKRNPTTAQEMDEVYKNVIAGKTRTELNKQFLSGLKINSILEVGCNIGTQLLVLSNMGYKNLYGIELQKNAVDIATTNTKGRDINIIKGSAFDIPFKDSFFDLVFTSTLLVHILPNDINIVLDEIYRCSRRYIWGYEYFSDEYKMINYRGEENLLWKADFARFFEERFKYLKLIKKEVYPRLDNPKNFDIMYLLEKQTNHTL